jgi:hypothetical protein
MDLRIDSGPTEHKANSPSQEMKTVLAAIQSCFSASLAHRPRTDVSNCGSRVDVADGAPSLPLTPRPNRLEGGYTSRKVNFERRPGDSAFGIGRQQAQRAFARCRLVASWNGRTQPGGARLHHPAPARLSAMPMTNHAKNTSQSPSPDPSPRTEAPTNVVIHTRRSHCSARAQAIPRHSPTRSQTAHALNKAGDA